VRGTHGDYTTISWPPCQDLQRWFRLANCQHQIKLPRQSIARLTRTRRVPHEFLRVPLRLSAPVMLRKRKRRIRKSGMTEHHNGHGTTPTIPWAHLPRRILPARDVSIQADILQWRASPPTRVNQDKEARSLKALDHLLTYQPTIDPLRATLLLLTSSLPLPILVPLIIPVPLLETASTTSEAFRPRHMPLPSRRLYPWTESPSSRPSLPRDPKLDPPQPSPLRFQSWRALSRQPYELRSP
jgi:hypothetical protein